MKAFFSKIWSWIKLNKVISIVIASVFTVGVACSIVLPITLHEHSYSAEWSNDAENHWHDATCKHDEEKSDLAAHTYTNACDTDCNTCGATRTITHAHETTLTAGDTTHYYLCSVCGDKKDETAHVFDKEIASIEYLKTKATATTKAQYYKSCICGAKSDTEYFETDKAPANLQVSDISKTYDGTPVSEPTVTFDGVGAENFAYYKGDEKLTERPTDAGTYKVVVTVDETDTHAGDRVEREFTIAKKVLSNLTAELTYADTNLFEVPLGAANGIVAGDVADGIKVCITFANKNVGAAVTGASLNADGGDNYTNYELDLTTCTASIVKKVLNVSKTFEYVGSDVAGRQLHAPDASLGGVIAGDELFIEVLFESGNAGALVLTGEDAPCLDGADCDNYTLGTYNFSIVPKKLNVPTLSKDYNGNNAVNYAFTATDGLVSGDSCTLTFNVTETDIGYYKDAAMTNIALTNTNYKIEVSTCNLHILDANDLVMLLTNKYNLDGDFILVVEIRQGTVRVGDSIVLSGTPDKVYDVLTIEKLNKQLEFATVGEEVGLYVSGMTDLAEIPGASFLYEEDNIPKMATEFLADVHMLTSAEGGRQTPIFNFNDYKPNMLGLGASQEISITLIDVYESDDDTILSPGVTAFVKITLTNPLPACLLETATFKLYETTKYVGNVGNIDLVVYDSFASALVVDCDTAHSETMQVYVGQKVYVKMKLHEIDTQQEQNAVLSAFSIKATTGSAATFTGETYYNNTTTTYETVTTATTQMSMNDLTCWSDGDYFYYVITCVTAGEISIIVE